LHNIFRKIYLLFIYIDMSASASITLTPVVLPLTGSFATTDPITFDKTTGTIQGLDKVGFNFDDPNIITQIVTSLTSDIPVTLGPGTAPATSAIVATSGTAPVTPASPSGAVSLVPASPSGAVSLVPASTPGAVSLVPASTPGAATSGTPPGAATSGSTSEYIEEMEDTKFSGGKSIKKRVRKNRKTKKHGNKKYRNKK